MKLLLCLTIIYCNVDWALSQKPDEECTADMFPTECSKIVTHNTVMACYLRNLGSDQTSVFGMCCETCRKLRDPAALSDCEYGDKAFGCSQQNCTVPSRNDTKTCCKTCRQSLEAEMNAAGNSKTTPSSNSVTTTKELITDQPTTNGETILKSNRETTTSAISTSPSKTTTNPTMMPTMTPSPKSMLTTSKEPTNISKTHTEPVTMWTTSAQQTTKSTTNKEPTTVSPSHTRTETKSISTTTFTPKTTSILNEPTTISAMTSKIATALTMTTEATTMPVSNKRTIPSSVSVERHLDNCQDDKNCRNIRPARCYSEHVREECCARCKSIAKNNPKDCQYGDKFPTWCRKMFARYPKYICTFHTHLCCYTCGIQN